MPRQFPKIGSLVFPNFGNEGAGGAEFLRLTVGLAAPCEDMQQLGLEFFQAREVVGVGFFQLLDGVHFDKYHLARAFLAAALFFAYIGFVCQFVVVFGVDGDVCRFVQGGIENHDCQSTFEAVAGLQN